MHLAFQQKHQNTLFNHTIFQQSQTTNTHTQPYKQDEEKKKYIKIIGIHLQFVMFAKIIKPKEKKKIYIYIGIMNI